MATHRQPNEGIDKAQDQGRGQSAPDLKPGESLAQAPHLTPTFEHAQQPREQSLEPATPAPVKEPMTYAQQIDPIKGLSQRQPAISDHSMPNTGQGSQMVRDDHPAPRPSNTMPEARMQDAATFNKKWENEVNKANTNHERPNPPTQETAKHNSELAEARAAADVARSMRAEFAQQRDVSRGAEMQ